MAGYVISALAFALPLVLGWTGIGRPRVIVLVGGALAFASTVGLMASRAENGNGQALVPLWFLAGLAGLLYVIWCGGLWLGRRLRRTRTG